MWKRVATSVVLAMGLCLLWAASPPPTQAAAPAAAANDDSGPLIVPLPEKLNDEYVFGKLKKMQFSVIAKGKSHILVAYGPVDDEVSGRFREALDVAKPVEEVWLYSPGGNLYEGLEVGRILHARKMATHIVKGARCVSACNFMFMGGVFRYIDTGATIEVHMFSNNSADRLLRDMIRPPATFPALIKRYPTVDLDMIIGQMHELFPQIELTDPVVSAAKGAVKQKNKIDADDEAAFGLAVVDQIIVSYNEKHPDAPVNEGEIISRLTLSEDVKGIQMSSAQIAADIARYLTEMSLSLKFLTRFAALHNDTPTGLTRAELREFNVINVD